MGYYETGVIYSEQSDNYIKILSVDERVNYNQTCVIKLTQYSTENKSMSSEDINIYLGDKITFGINDFSTNFRLRSVWSPLDFSIIKQYIPGDVVLYDNRIFCLKNRAEVGTLPSSANWNEIVNYTNKTYTENSIILFEDGNVYRAKQSVGLNETPVNSSKWEKVKGKMSLYVGIISNGGRVSCEFISGNEQMLQFENNNTMQEYTLDGYKQTINGKPILTPQTLSYQNNKFTGYIKDNIILDKYSNKVFISHKPASGGMKIATADLVKNTTLNFDLEIDNLFFSEKNISGKVKVTLIGDKSSQNVNLKAVGYTSDFASTSFNIEVWNDNGILNFYFIPVEEGFFKISLNNIVCLCKETNVLNQGCGYVWSNGVNCQDEFRGNKVTSLFNTRSS